MTLIEIVILGAAMILLGIFLGRYERKYKQKHFCPKCACKDNCNIGYSVVSNEETTGCYICMNSE